MTELQNQPTGTPPPETGGLRMIAHMSGPEWAKAAAITAGAFLVLGTFTALWANPFFIRMTPVTGWDYVILGVESALLGLYLGMRAPSCAVRTATAGGVLGFLGFGCSLCNQVLLFIFGGSTLLTYFEPYRYWVGLLGIAIIGYALWRKLGRRNVQTAATA